MLRTQAEEHAAWERRYLATAPFNPRPAGSDYNLHYADVEATADRSHVTKINGIDDVTYSNRTGRVRHRLDGTLIGVVDKHAAGGWAYVHSDESAGAGHTSLRKAVLALIEHHNGSRQ
jgi:hypothetical protein